ncbi:MAG: hypothetical protein F6J87_07605 [Spirulina sp. SIO3F2]|nr:hypothetical protein [Spirulina sp. SIO3F2]
MLSKTHPTISALCYSIIADRCPAPDSSNPFPHNEVVRFVIAQTGQMPDFFRLPIALLTLSFDLWGIVQGGAPFHCLPHQRRDRQIQSWRNSPLSPCRDLIRLYESLTIFCWYAMAENADCLER